MHGRELFIYLVEYHFTVNNKHQNSPVLPTPIGHIITSLLNDVSEITARHDAFTIVKQTISSVFLDILHRALNLD